jgi:CHAD domain-containing protein
MKKRKMISTIRKRFNRISKLLEKLASSFNADDIHRMRIEIKKLKAFRKLTSSRNRRPRLPAALRNLYQSAGVIRDLQLQIKRLEDFSFREISSPAGYQALLREELEKETAKFRTRVPSPIVMAFEERIMIKDLPSSVRKNTIRKFFNKERKKIMAATGGVMRYEQFHRLRKIMKTLQYNKSAIVPILDGYQPTGVNEVTELLGRYCDACTSIRGFQRFSKSLNESEKLKAKALYTSFQEERSMALRKLKERIGSVPQLLDHDSV